ncbi:MAG: hypothetical protein ACI9O4_000606 [Chitinophagales bacterium]|jgi:hypothetical protein
MGTQKITYQPKVNYYIIAIASVLKDYRISFFINQELHLNLERDEDLLSENKSKESAQKFGKYYYQDEKSEFEYFLLQNKQQGGLYLKAFKNFDFLFMVKTIDEDTIDIGSLFTKIKNIPDVQLALELHKLKPAELKRIEKDF